MNLKNFSVLMLALALIFTLGGAASAGDDRPHEGKVISVDNDGMVLTILGE